MGRHPAAAGVLFALAAYGAWGFFPLYFRLFEGIPSLEILLHRSAWSVPFLLLLVALGGRWRSILPVLRQGRTLLPLLASAALLAGNWLVFIWAIQVGRVLECSLGYYINPLVSVALGVTVLGERLSRAQFGAILLAAAGVAVLAWEGDRFPWVALTLALSFGLYGLLRKTMALGAAEGLLAETALLLPFALGGIVWLAATGEGHFGLGSLEIDLLLASTGVVTATPLILFAAAARRLTLSSVGMFQYIAPTMQFLMAVFLFGEAFTPAYAVTFALIWAAVALYLFENWRRLRRTRRPLSAPARS